MSAVPALPLRPRTLGELLDAATTLLRRDAGWLFGGAVLLAALEQAVLWPLRERAGMTAPFYGPHEYGLGDFWWVAAAGFGLEGVIVTLLAARASVAAVPLVLGRPVAVRSRPFAVVALALAFGVVAALGALVALVPWFFVFGLFVLTAPALILDDAGNPVGRSAALAVRQGLRGLRVMVAAYLTWFAIRFALGAGWTAVADLVGGGDPERLGWLSPVAWGLANAVAYPALACVAVVLLLDVRVRTEGLDIAMDRARARGSDPASTLVHRR